MEVHVHRCPRGLQEELDAVFAEKRGKFRESIVITTAQHASVDLVSVGPRVELEKEVLLKQVFPKSRREQRLWRECSARCSIIACSQLSCLPAFSALPLSLLSPLL